MVKKYVAISLCVLSICAVFGLSARTSYEEVKTALESIDETAEVLVDDLQSLHVLAFVVENFNVEATTNISAGVRPETEVSPKKYLLIYQSLWLDDDGMVQSSNKTFEFESPEKLGKIQSILNPLTWSKNIPQGEGLWENVLDGVKTVVFILGVIVSVIVFVVWFLLDAVLTAWEVVVMALYILGFSMTL